jgi:hypothetical protein
MSVLGTAVAAAILAVVAPTAAAGPQAAKTATGNFAFASRTVTPVLSLGGDTLLSEVASISYSGGLIGTVSARDTILARSDGSFSAYGVESCNSCTIGGRTGSFIAVFSVSGSATHFTGTETFVGGGGGLAGLHGGGTFSGDGTLNSYAYDYRFAAAEH